MKENAHFHDNKLELEAATRASAIAFLKKDDKNVE